MANYSIDSITRYLQGQMDDAERQLFESEMENNPSLSQEVSDHKRIVEQIKIEARHKLKARLSALDAPPVSKAPISKWHPPFLWGLLGIVALLALAYFYMNRSTTQPTETIPTAAPTPIQPVQTPQTIMPQSPQQTPQEPSQKLLPEGPNPAPQAKTKAQKGQEIYAAVFETYMHPSLEVGTRGGAASLSSMEQLQTAYLAKDMKLVIQQYGQLSDDDRHNPQAEFLFANALMSLGKMKSASIVFEQVLAGNTKRFKEPSEWYHALCVAKMSNFSVLNEMQNIAEKKGHAYQAQAQSFMKALE